MSEAWRRARCSIGEMLALGCIENDEEDIQYSIFPWNNQVMQDKNNNLFSDRSYALIPN